MKRGSSTAASGSRRVAPSSSRKRLSGATGPPTRSRFSTPRASRSRPAGLTLPRNLSFLTGDALARSSRLTEAAGAFREEIRAYPTNAEAYARFAIVLAVEHETRGEVTALLESMYRANPSPTTARLAEKTLDSIGDRPGATRWSGRGRSASAPPTIHR